MKIDFVKTLEASAPYIPGTIYFESNTSLIKVATANNQYRVYGGVRDASYDASADTLTIQNGNGDEIYIDFSQYVNQDEYKDDQYVISYALNELNTNLLNQDTAINSMYDNFIHRIYMNNYNVDITNGTAYLSQSNADWNATSGVQRILNKPDLSLYMTTADYEKDEEVIAAAFNDLNDRMRLFEDSSLTYINTINTIKVNGSVLTPDASKAVNISVPTDASLAETFLPLYGGIMNEFGEVDFDDSNGYLQIQSYGIENYSNGSTTTRAGSAVFSTTGLEVSTSTTGYLANTAQRTEYTDGSIYKYRTVNNVLTQYTYTFPDASGTFALTSNIPTDASIAAMGYTKNALTGVSFNGVDASVTNGVAAITATIPPDKVFIIPVTKNGTSYTTTVTKDEAREALYAGKLLFVLYNNIVMPLRHYDSDDYGDYYFYAISNSYIYTMNLVAGSSDGRPLSCYYSEKAIPSAVTESTVSGWGFTKNTGTLTGVKFNNTNATINGTVAEITATIPTVNNATLSILKNGTSVGTFTANSSTDTSINIQVNELPTPSTTGTMLCSNGSSWVESQNIYDIVDTVQIAYNKSLSASGTLGITTLDTAGILKYSFSDWSWIRIEYNSGGTAVTENLQDYLDDHMLPEVNSLNFGNFLYVAYDSTKGYYWNATSPIWYNNNDNCIYSSPFLKFVFRTTNYSDGESLSIAENGVKHIYNSQYNYGSSDWSWIAKTDLSTNITVTLQDTLNGKQNTLVGSGTGQNIKTVNNNSLVGSGNVSVGTLTGVKFNNVSATINGTVAEITATIPAAVTESTVSGWGFTKNTGTLTSHADHKLLIGSASATTASSNTITYVESLTGTATATHGDLTVTPTLKTITIPSAVTESTVSGWGFTKNTGTLTEHATHKLTATNNNATSTSGTITFVESLTGTNTATSGDLTITATRKSVTIPSAPGTLKTNNTAAQTASASEALSGTINLHKVAKTGTYSDLIGTPTIPAAANNATISIQKGGTAVDSFTVNASTNKTINIPNELPTVTATDNGKILKVVNGAWAAATPVTVYSGSNTPNNSTGINGDIYIQS